MIVYHELSSVESDLGFNAKTLYALSNNILSHYKTVNIPKSKGGIRTLSVPDEALKSVQRAIAEKLLTLEKVSVFATAYKDSSNLKSNAKPHVGKEKILKLDIYNFFDSINYSQVKEKAFPKARYSDNIRVLLSLLCYYKDVLPQGAPTSPIISNIIMYDFDNVVGEWCKWNKISYTRYCDDMTFSGSFESEKVISFVETELKKIGFLLNKKKIKAVSSHNRQSVTGVVVNEKLNISKEYKQKIRSEVYYINKFGTEEHLKKIKFSGTKDMYLASLLGKINYVLQIRPNDNEFLKYKEIIKKALRSL